MKKLLITLSILTLLSSCKDTNSITSGKLIEISFRNRYKLTLSNHSNNKILILMPNNIKIKEELINKEVIIYSNEKLFGAYPTLDSIKIIEN